MLTVQPVITRNKRHFRLVSLLARIIQNIHLQVSSIVNFVDYEIRIQFTTTYLSVQMKYIKVEIKSYITPAWYSVGCFSPFVEGPISCISAKVYYLEMEERIPAT